MRPIKYRAWIKYAKVMTDVIGINFEKQFILATGKVRYEFSDIELMQSTGLFDKNGKEIYEGDILKGESGQENKRYEFFVTPEWNDGASAYCIHDGPYWQRGSVKSSPHADHLSAWHAVYNFEIIGNIHENPELLTNQ